MEVQPLSATKETLPNVSSATALHIPDHAVPASLHLPSAALLPPVEDSLHVSCVSPDGNLQTSKGMVVCLGADGHRERCNLCGFMRYMHSPSWKLSWGSLYKLTPYFNILQTQHRQGWMGPVAQISLRVSWHWRSPLTGPRSAQTMLIYETCEKREVSASLCHSGHSVSGLRGSNIPTSSFPQLR